MPRSVEDYYPADKFDYVRVCVFRTHERIKNGRLIKVGRSDLQKTADNHNELWEKFARASPMSKGHTLDTGPDGADVPESAQPDTAGVLVRFEVDTLPEEPDADFLFALWCRPKEQRKELEAYQSISPEYYPSRHLIYPASLLKPNCPELVDMPALPLLYAVELQPGEEKPYRLTIDSPFRYTSTEKTMNPDEMKKDDKKEAPKSPDDKAMDSAKDDAKKGSVEDKGDLADIKAMLAQLQPLIEMAPKLMQLVELMDSEEEGADAMAPDKGGDKAPDMPSPDMGKGVDKPSEKDSMKSMGSTPLKFDTSMPSSTNCNIPGSEKDKKEGYKMNDDDKVKYAAMEKEFSKLKIDLEATRKVSADLYKKNRKAEAERAVSDLENVHNIQYATSEIRQQDIDMIAKLDEDSGKQYVEMAKVRYQKKLPDSESVKEVAKYAVEAQPELTAKTPEEAWENAMKKIKEMANAKK